MTLAQEAAWAAGLDDIHARIVANSAKARSFEPGDVIARRGDILESWMYLASGLITGTVTLDDGQVHPSLFLCARRWLGEYNLVNGEPIACDWVATTPVDVLFVPAEFFLRRIQDSPSFVRACLSRMAKSAQLNADALIAYKLGSPLFKCLYVIGLICQVVLKCNAKGPEFVRHGTVAVPISQDSLAKFCGISRSRCTEFLQQLRRSGLLEVSYRNFRVLHPHAWRDWVAALRYSSMLPASSITMEDFDLEIRKFGIGAYRSPAVA